MVVANEVSKNIQDFLKKSSKTLNKPIESQLPTETSVTSAPPFLVAKSTNWDMSEKIKSAIIIANQEGKSAGFVLQMYSKSLMKRRNATLRYRADLKEQDPSIQSYEKLPATLMIKRTEERKYSLKKEF